MAALVVTIQGKPQPFELREGENVVGRRPDCTICIPEPSVSGRHAVIHVRGEDFLIEDAGSRNGTLVNRQALQGRVKLNHNDVVQFGDAQTRFDNPSAATVQAPRADIQATLQLGPGRINIDDVQQSMITGHVATGGQYDVLAANPQAKLKAVLEISRSLAGSVDLTALLPKILDTLFQVFKHADRGCILLRDEKTDNLVPRAMRHRRENEDTTVRLSRTVINKVLSEKAGVLSADAASEVEFSASQSIADLNIRSMMCVPLLGLEGNVLGILSLDSQNRLGQFTHDDLEVLMTVAGQAALSYETARLAQEFAEKQKQDNELQIARAVQHALLPSVLPVVEGYEFFASYDSAQAVGGDYYDCFRRPEGRIMLSFGDVAGKGVPAR